MAQIVKLRRSSVSGQKPTNDNLQLGELAVNTTDGKVFLAKSGSLGPTIEEIVTTNTIITGSINLIGKITVSGDISGSNIRALSFIKSGGTSSQYLMADGSVSTLTNPITGTGTTNYIPKFSTNGTISDSQIFEDGTYVYTKKQLIAGYGLSNVDNFIRIANTGVGYGTGFRFDKDNNGAGLSVTETVPDSTMYEFFMSDNPDGGDMMQMRFTDWQSANTLTVPFWTSGKENRFIARQNYFYGSINQSTNGIFTTSNFGEQNGSQNQLQINQTSKLRLVGSSVNITDLNINDYNGEHNHPIWIKLDTTTTFAWGYGSHTGTAVQAGIALSTSATTLSNGIKVTFSATTGTVGDLFTFRAIGKPVNYFGTTNFDGNITATSFIKSGGTSSQYLMADGSVSTLTNPVTGTGTTNYLSKFTASGTIGNSLIYDDGDKVGIGINSGLVGKFEVVGTSVSGSFIAARFHNNTTNAAGVKTKIELPIFNGSSGGTIEEIGNSIDGYRLNMYQSQTSGVITFGTAGNNERMRITSTGDIGIGTTSPSSKLNVVGDQLIVASSSGTTTLGIQIKPTISVIPTGQVHAYIGVGDTNIGLNGDLIIAPRTNVNASVRIYTGTNPSEKIRIDGATGNLGVGTTTPNSKLDVNGNTTLSGSLMVSQSLIQYSSVVSVPSGSVTDVVTFNTSSYTATFFDFVITSGSNTRAGTIFTTWNGNNIEYTETSTNDIGDTTSIRLSTSLSAGSVKLQATSIMGSWSVKTLARMI